MISQENVPSQERVYPFFIEQYLDSSFELQRVTPIRKFTPRLSIAKPEDAYILADICKEVYENSYPYREMEDPTYVRKMIQSPEHHFVIFKTKEGEPAGCFRCALDFKQKKGYMGGFMVRPKFQGELDVVKAIMLSYIWMWTTFKNKILVWWCENRTAQTASQYITAVCGIHTVAFFPNKDIFYNQIESDVMGMIFVKRALREMRKKKRPKFIKSALNCFLYTNNLYNLGRFKIEKPNYFLDNSKIKQFQKRLKKKVLIDEYGYKYVTFTIEGTDSYLSFIHTTHLKNFEKAKYKVSCIEEFYLFVKQIKKSMKEFNIRYCELFLSAYKPEYQQIVYDEGFRARGYIPCWYYDKEFDEFEDAIVFNYYKGNLEHLNLLSEGQKLVKTLNFIYQ
ncbi:MAG: GNAT family N-acetyltransferase [Promethearchaeota archaeon]